MTQTSPSTPAATRPRTSTLDRRTLMRLAETEYQHFTTLLRSLTLDDWTRPTDCANWNVRAIAGHALGMAEMAASIREGRRQQKAASRRGGVFIDELTAQQVEEHAAMTAQRLVERYATIAPRAARARRRTPGLIRRRTMPIPQTVGNQPEAWTLGYLIDTILTRDPWMHRIDISRAIGEPPMLTADHDGVLVADIVTEWAGRHGRPCGLQLHGPAGGSWTFGHGGPHFEFDAIEFCRMLSGREPATDLLANEVPF